MVQVRAGRAGGRHRLLAVLGKMARAGRAGGRHRLLAVVAALACLLAPTPAALAGSGGAAAGGSRPRGKPLAGRAMWIWELAYTDGGRLGAIIAGAHRYGISTLLIKSSDGYQGWPQFNRGLVSELHRAGLHVCAWQYVYGNHPVTEAYLGAGAVHDGADCLVVDAESQYEGKYISAQTYVQRLRRLIGPRYPVALAGFPYVDFHPAFPYSVFLGPGGAQLDAPQMYWRDIGVTTDAVFAHTYSYNLIYERPIFPLGQIYANPPPHQIVRFRELARVYRAPGVSWWDWQEASNQSWIAVSRPAGALPGYAPYEAMAPIAEGYVGDLAVWAQEHLIAAGLDTGVDGHFGPGMAAAVQAFQAAHGLVPDGIIGPDTWLELLRYRPVGVIWSRSHRRLQATLAGHRRVIIAPPPISARRPDRGPEITAGAGGNAHAR